MSGRWVKRREERTRFLGGRAVFMGAWLCVICNLETVVVLKKSPRLFDGRTSRADAMVRMTCTAFPLLFNARGTAGPILKFS